MIKRIAFLFFLCFLSLDLFALFEEITVSGKVIVKDTATGLEWTKEYATNKTWQQALDYCETLNYGDYSDWRLPNIEELKTLIDDTIYSPASTFPGMPSSLFWSSSSNVYYTSSAWNVDFSLGYVHGNVKSSYNYARCVRDGVIKVAACTNTLPENASWISANADGQIIQMWNGTEWTPPADSCALECDEGYVEDAGECILITESCNSNDDNVNGRIDDAGLLQMSCMREIWRYARTVDAKNVRLQPSIDYGNVPSAIVGYNSPGSYPGFVIYDTNVPDSTKLYYCLRNTSPYDNYYTTNSSDPLCSGSYTSITEDDYIGYILINDPGTDRYYANWLYNNAGGIYYNQPVKATGLYIMKYSSTGQHYFCGSNQIAGLISQGWCCLRGPSSSCAGNWCGGEENTTPVGYIFIP